MKFTNNAFKALAAIAIVVMAVGCVNELQEKENIAVAAGFKVITPTKPDHVALLPTLPKDKVTSVMYQGKLLYILPDVKNNRAYVGGPAEYQAYRQMRLAKQISDDNLAAAQMNQMAAMNQMNWNTWGGWNSPYGYRHY
jgi:hypothetical protein